MVSRGGIKKLRLAKLKALRTTLLSALSATQGRDPRYRGELWDRDVPMHRTDTISNNDERGDEGRCRVKRKKSSATKLMMPK